MSDKVRYPRAAAIAVAKELCDRLKPHTERIMVCGSLRRRKESVGDVEIVYIPKTSPALQLAQSALFEIAGLSPQTALVNLANEALIRLLSALTIQPRKNVNGSIMWGDKNKLAVHMASGIPIDFFSATESNWFNYIVCRTGGAENNVAIASAAQAKRWKWHPYRDGFTDQEGNIVKVESEQDVFRLVGLAYKEPWER